MHSEQPFKKRPVVIAITVFAIILQGCCPDQAEGPNAVYDALTRHELTTFVDSFGNNAQLLLSHEGFNRHEHCCDDCPNGATLYVQSPFAEFTFLPPHDGTMSYESGYYRRLTFPEFSIWNFEEVEVGDTTIQGYTYVNCWGSNATDSLGNEVYSVLVDKSFGLVMFSYKDQYRWERILD